MSKAVHNAVLGCIDLGIKSSRILGMSGRLTLAGHHLGKTGLQHRPGEVTQRIDLADAKAEAGIVRRSPCIKVGEGRDAMRRGVRTSMSTACQQRYRTAHAPCNDLS